MKMLKEIRHAVVKNLVNVPGWRTNRKILIIESDDWGMIRMRSKKSYDWFLRNGYRVDQCPYNRNDSIESNDDLELLLDVLSGARDQNGKPAVMTMNTIVANPDFEKIKESGFSRYYYEPLTESLKRYPGRDRVLKLYKQGIEQHILRPQFHGREHLNVNRWMEELNSGNKILMDAFHQEMFTVTKLGSIDSRRDYLDAFGMGYTKEWVSMEEIVESGLNLFKKLWGYKSNSFIAPCYIWPGNLERILAERGVTHIQGTHMQLEPSHSSNVKKKYHYQGQKNQYGQLYTVRNVHFEPTERGENGAVNRALRDIEIAFRNMKPAVISSHRLNYIGSIRTENRDVNLRLLETLLKSVLDKFPDVEFMSSEQLGELIGGEA